MENENNIQTEGNQTQDQLRRYPVLKIITAIVFAITTIFFIYVYADVLNTPVNKPEDGLGKGIGIAVILVVGLLLYIPSIILAIIGLIITIISYIKKICSLGTMIYFIVFTLLPVMAFFVIGYGLPLVIN